MASMSAALFVFMLMTFSVLEIKEFDQHVVSSIQRDYQIGSADTNDVLFVGQGVRWTT